MATRTIVTCDHCKEEIKPGERILYFSAIRWAPPDVSAGGGCVEGEKFGLSEFCSDACVIGAVRGLLNA